MSTDALLSIIETVVVSVLDGDDLPVYGARVYGAMIKFLSRFYSVLVLSERYLDAFCAGVMLDIVNDSLYKKKRYVYPREKKLIRRFLENDFRDLATQMMSGFFNGKD
jgi:hypothetical protein